ncbi:hypothetical protein EDB19DRAFT_1947173 [Suillus lakei]|nr:hypothetical protein EDB19DRAFT_1947173 [Suillus lakei]
MAARLHRFSIPASTNAQSMQTAQTRCSPAPVNTDHPINEDATKLNAGSEEPVVSIEGNLAKNMQVANSLEQILDVLRGSTIAEERGKDENSKFWATYKKVSTEYDNDFLGRANDDMGIILTFPSTLLSSSECSLIREIPPNVLLLQFIQIAVNGTSAVNDISTLSSSTEYSSSTVWMQALAYASLAFSVLAAFGAVMGKQWLNSYKAARGRGTLEERGIQRQMKLNELEYFHVQTVLQAFLVLLQISLLLFGLSLSANIWTHQITISSIIICTTAFGILFYAGTIFVSALRPDSPFRTPGSDLVGAICKKILPGGFTLTPNIFRKSSAIRWILETSTDPDVVGAAAAMVPLAPWPLNFDASAIYTRLVDNFMVSRDRPELYRKAMAHLCIQPVEINPTLVQKQFQNHEFRETRAHFIHDAFMAGCDAYRQFQNTQQIEFRRQHRADARTALRTMVVHGLDYQLSRPDDEALIWRDGPMQWHDRDGHAPCCQEFDWVIDYLKDSAPTGPTDTADDETEGDALLALSAMQGLGSSTKQLSYIRSLMRCMAPSRPPRVRHAALRAVFEARGELASITSNSVSHGVNARILDELSCALLTVVRPNDDQTIGAASTHYHPDYGYVRLICALTKHAEWRQRLARDGHIRRCISLVDKVYEMEQLGGISIYLTVIVGHTNLLSKDLPFSQEKWRLLIKNTWENARCYMTNDNYVDCVDYIDGIPAIVTATRLTLPGLDNAIPSPWLADLAEKVHWALADLQRRHATYVNNGVAQATFDVAISSAKGLYHDLGHMISPELTLQRDKSDDRSQRGERSQSHNRSLKS